MHKQTQIDLKYIMFTLTNYRYSYYMFKYAVEILFGTFLLIKCPLNIMLMYNNKSSSTNYTIFVPKFIENIFYIAFEIYIPLGIPVKCFHIRKLLLIKQANLHKYKFAYI